MPESDREEGNDDDRSEFWLEFQVCSDGFDENDLPVNGTAQPAATTASPISPSSFHRFRKLPAEVRLQIWECAIQPRIVLVACLSTCGAAKKRAQLAVRPRRRPVPVLLHVCHESRQLALRHYERAFGAVMPPGPGGAGRGATTDPDAAPKADATVKARSMQGGAGGGVWFNFRLDALLLVGELDLVERGIHTPMVHLLRDADARRVRHVACAFEELRQGMHDSLHVFRRLLELMGRFPAIERLLLTTTPRDQEGGDGDYGMSLPTTDNVVQRLWWGWTNGTSIVTSSLADKQVLMVREGDMASFIAANS